MEQCINLYKTRAIQRARHESKGSSGPVPRIHGTVFDISTGLLKHLNIDFETRLKGIDSVYTLIEDC